MILVVECRKCREKVDSGAWTEKPKKIRNVFCAACGRLLAYRIVDEEDRKHEFVFSKLARVSFRLFRGWKKFASSAIRFTTEHPKKRKRKPVEKSVPTNFEGPGPSFC